MRTTWYVLAAAIAAGLALWLIGTPPAPVAPPAPDATPAPAPCPRCPRLPRPFMPPAERAGQSREPAVDLMAMPANLRRANIASKGLGCCTFRSAEYAAHWQNVPALYGFPEWLRSSGIEGGGTPRKQADMVRRIAADRGLPAPQFVQYEGNNPAIIEMALKTGRLPCVTWGGNHMLVCVHLDQQQAAIVDNNAPEQVQWMGRAQFLRQWTTGGGGWVFVLLAPPPPPPPAGRPKRAARECPPDCPCGCKEGRPCDCGGPHPPGTAPRRPAPAPKAPQKPVEPMGPKVVGGAVEWTYGGVERYTLGDTVVTRQAVEDALADDSGKLHLTVIGTPEERKAALAQLGDASRYLVQEYGRDNWALAFGFAPSARLYLQDRAGMVLLRADDAAGLAERLRRADPSYDPKADPSGAGLPGLGIPDLGGYVPYALAGAAGLALLLAWGSRGQQARAPTSAPAPAPAPVPPAQPAPPAPAPAQSAADQVALELGREVLREMVVRRAKRDEDE